LTAKTECEESHAADTQAAIAGFLDRVCWPAAPEEAVSLWSANLVEV
jgi:hypothetical protein